MKEKVEQEESQASRSSREESNSANKNRRNDSSRREGADLDSHQRDQTGNVSDIGMPSAWEIFGQNYNRVDLIDEKRAASQQELEQLEDSFPTDSSRILLLQAFIPVLHKASEYQKEMIAHLQETSKKWTAKEAAIAESLSAFFKINQTPNKIEKIALQLENDAHHLALTQNRLLAVQRVAAQLQDPAFRSRLPLNAEAVVNKCIHLTKAIAFQKALLSQRATYATSLHPPYENLDSATQRIIQANKEAFIKEERAAIKETRLASPPWEHPPVSIECQIALNEVAAETEKPQPNEQVIAWYRAAADLYEQALEAKNLRQLMQADYLYNAGLNLSEAAKEAQKPQSNELVIAWYSEAADLYQQSLEAKNLRQLTKEDDLHNAGLNLSEAAKEAQKPQPNEQVITWYSEAADLLRQAVTLQNLGEDEEVIFLDRVGRSLSGAAKEAQKLQPNEQVITWYSEVADLHRQVITARNFGEDQKANYLNTAAGWLFHTAKEAQKPQPNQQAIDDSLRQVKENKERADSIPQSSCAIS